jgi:hypothetical protein
MVSLATPNLMHESTAGVGKGLMWVAAYREGASFGIATVVT